MQSSAGHCKTVSPCTAHRLTSGITVAVHVGQLELRLVLCEGGRRWASVQARGTRAAGAVQEQEGAESGRTEERAGVGDGAAEAAGRGAAGAGAGAGAGLGRKQKFTLAPAKPATTGGATATRLQPWRDDNCMPEQHNTIQSNQSNPMAAAWHKLPTTLAELCIATTLRCGQSFR
jgi:hypothetical protein